MLPDLVERLMHASDNMLESRKEGQPVFHAVEGLLDEKFVDDHTLALLAKYAIESMEREGKAFPICDFVDEDLKVIELLRDTQATRFQVPIPEYDADEDWVQTHLKVSARL